ncbi:MAG: hypothetical protein JO147_11600 [Actinobacteria bacterium]|nr:hypothetical protein [Actinomycetota bacterium]
MPAGRRRALTAAGAAAAAFTISRLPEPPLRGWTRTNFRGRLVSLSGGLAAAGGVIVGAALSGRPVATSAIVAAGAGLAAGAYDDLLAQGREQAGDKGLTGHLNAIRHGRVSGGVVKVVVIGAGAVTAAMLGARGRCGGLVRTVLDAALIAGSANLVNLLDLRPGRAGKFVLAVAVSGLTGAPEAANLSAALLGATASTLPADLAERELLGDLGSNALGACLGVRLTRVAGPARTALLVGVIGLNAISERISFSAVIDCVPPLRRLDELGRVPSLPAHESTR